MLFGVPPAACCTSGSVRAAWCMTLSMSRCRLRTPPPTAPRPASRSVRSHARPCGIACDGAEPWTAVLQPHRGRAPGPPGPCLVSARLAGTLAIVLHVDMACLRRCHCSRQGPGRGSHAALCRPMPRASPAARGEDSPVGRRSTAGCVLPGTARAARSSLGLSQHPGAAAAAR